MMNLTISQFCFKNDLCSILAEINKEVILSNKDLLKFLEKVLLPLCDSIEELSDIIHHTDMLTEYDCLNANLENYSEIFDRFDCSMNREDIAEKILKRSIYFRGINTGEYLTILQALLNLSDEEAEVWFNQYDNLIKLKNLINIAIDKAYLTD